MAQNITLLGASYTAVPAVTLPKTGGGTAQFDDTTDADATAADITAGKTAYVNGVKLTGTGSGGGGVTPTGTINITANDTYDVTNYASAVVNVAGSSWTKVAETEYTVSTTSTSAATVATWATGHSELWTSDKIVYVRVRDTAGKRAGYFYGTDTFFMNMTAKNDPSNTSNTAGSIMNIWAYSNSNVYTYRYGYMTTGYGVFPNMFYSDGRIRIASRYNSNYTLTVNGTYKIEVYLLDPPTGAPIFT